MDLERSPPPEAASPAGAAGGAACSICLDPVVGRGGGRSVAKLQCGHEFHLGGWVIGETCDITSDLPFGFQWCPFSGFTQLASVFEEGEAETTSYHTAGDHSSAASSSLVCSYLALCGFLHPVHVPASSNSGAESAWFHQPPSGLKGQLLI